MKVINEKNENTNIVSGDIVYCERTDGYESFYGIFVSAPEIIVDLKDGSVLNTYKKIYKIGDKFSFFTITKRFDNVELHIK